jgi:hypothetical protein
VQSRYPRKSLPKSSWGKNDRTWYFRCPNCNKATIVVTHRMYADCGGKWCRGLIHLPSHQITEAEYKKAWAIK